MNDPLAFLAGGGAVARMIRERDWSGHPLGPPAGWTPEFRAALSLVLNSPESMILAWGPDLSFFFNDTYVPLLGPRLSWAMGERFDAVWADAWAQAKPIIDAALAGRAKRFEDLPWKLATDRGAADTWWSFSYSRVLDAAGEVAGLFIFTNETTARVLGDAALRESEESLRLVIEGAKDHAIFTTDPRGTITSWSGGAQAAFGWSPLEAIGRSSAMLSTPEDRTEGADAQELATAAERGQAKDERWHLTKDGRCVFMNGSVHPLPRDAQGRERGFIKVARDETAQLHAKEALRASEAELRRVTDALPFLISFVDRTLTYRFANAAYRTWFGRAPDEIVGRTIIEIAGEEAYAVRRAAIERALDGEPARIELDWPWPDGRRRIADIRYTPRRDAGGAVDGFYVLVQDVTTLHDATALLAERADTLAREVVERTEERDLIWETSPDLMLVIDFDGVFRRVNPAWTRLLGYAPHELVDHHVNEFVLPEDHTATVEAYTDAAAGGQPRIVNRYRHRDGSVRWISWVAAPAGKMTYATGRDITAAKVQEEALRQSQKMEAVGQLTGGVAHDFNNLLTIIRSSVDFLRRPNLSEDRRRRYMDAVSDTVDRAAKLTGQLLAFARRQALKPEVLDVGERLRAVADMLDTVTGARVRVVTALPDRPCFVRTDLSQFETALINMAVNARDAMDGAGTLTLRLVGGSPMPPIRGHGGGPGPFARIELGDTGSGITEADLGRIFEPFFTTKEVGKGTGLGLSQVFGFAKQSGGDVDVASTPGQGTTFALYLPEVEGEAPRDTDAHEAGLAPDGHGLQVLVVEDNIEVGRFATQILEDLGYRTEWVANAEDALARLGPSGDGFDVVFSDVVMPGMGGLALAEALRDRLPDLPVVLASGYSHVLAENDAHGFELLHKPYSAAQLSHVLRRITAYKRRSKLR